MRHEIWKVLKTKSNSPNTDKEMVANRFFFFTFKFRKFKLEKYQKHFWGCYFNFEVTDEVTVAATVDLFIKSILMLE